MFHCDCESDRCWRTKMWRSDRFRVVSRASYRRSVQDSFKLSLALLCTILMSAYFKLKIISGLIQAFFRPKYLFIDINRPTSPKAIKA